MNISSLALVASTALVSGATGYWLHPSTAPTAADAKNTAAPAGHTGTPSSDSAPLIAIASDGTATLRVEQQPLEWVLEQIALHSGWTDVKARASAASFSAASGAVPSADSGASAFEATCPEPSRMARQESATLLHQLERGSDHQRAQGLLDARSAGVMVPDSTLKTMFETDASEQVRLLAFETFLEARNGDNTALRHALEAALLVPSAAIQREAKARLDELIETQRIDAASNQPRGS